ncbi:MAG: S24 family peptidase [Acidobacteriota bacterium]|nr:S24 family peptidase [Acidobacteriota bacterium]
MPAAVLSFPSRGATQFCILELAHPGEPRVPVGVLLFDHAAGNLQFRLREDFRELDITEEDEEYLEALSLDFAAQIRDRGGKAFLEGLEDSLSNFLLISSREPASGASVDSLYERYIDTKVRPFVTHLPVYTLQAAATRFGEDNEVEAAGWRRVDGLRLAEGMFIARVTGRSMEPLIPDGSFCVFRAPVVGSRQGKRLLIEQFGSTETSARYTVKRYTSQKQRVSEDEWAHAEIRLEPLNPEFSSFTLEDGSFRVIAEFVAVLPDPQ